MIFVYYIIFGIVFIVFDLILGKLIKKDEPISALIEGFIAKLTGGDALIMFLVLIGGLIGSAYLATYFPENSIGYWISTISTIILVGYIGKSWLESIF